MKKGMFVVLEGIDGSGKETQQGMLSEWMNSLAIRTTPIFSHTIQTILHTL